MRDFFYNRPFPSNHYIGTHCAEHLFRFIFITDIFSYIFTASVTPAELSVTPAELSVTPAELSVTPAELTASAGLFDLCLEVKLPYDPVCPFPGKSVDTRLLSLPCSYAVCRVTPTCCQRLALLSSSTTKLGLHF